MMLNGTLENNCTSAEQLKHYLQEKAENHNYYKCYGTLSRIAAIRDTKRIYLKNGANWNDISDREFFNCKEREYTNFGKCFSFSREESIAMWMLYGGIAKLSGMIDFTKKGIKSILKTPTVSLGYFLDDNSFKTVTELKRDEFEIHITDVVYYTKLKSGYYIKRSDEFINNLPTKIFDELSECKKAYPWQYENECRLIVSINNNLINEKCDTVMIDLKDMDLGKSLERIYRGPNYPLKDTMGSLKSKLHNTVDWTLCNYKTCPCHKKKALKGKC